MIIYDLEDSVSPSPSDKKAARTRLSHFLSKDNLPEPRRVAVRVNDIKTPFFRDDIADIIHSAQDLHYVSSAVADASTKASRTVPLNIIPSIESARASFNLGEIAGWKSELGPMLGGNLTALLEGKFAAEDYTSIIRTPSRKELLFTRSQIVIWAKAFGLEAIDMVCVNYKDLDYLKNECIDGRQLGFTGKVAFEKVGSLKLLTIHQQAIHPQQVKTIQSTFVPTSQEILRAAKILHGMQMAHAAAKGAVGLEGEMIDAPMLKQAENVIKIAKLAGLDIPTI
ncbi:hypothetical protein H0H92_006044 [Tricholoma furcatifolium]|nr:hypothetical protein H0H92_006044 [Tricholoma furcatifolium]